MTACSGGRPFIPCCSDFMFQPLVASAGASSGSPRLTASHLRPPGSAQRHNQASWDRNTRNIGTFQDTCWTSKVAMDTKTIPQSRKIHEAPNVVIQGPCKQQTSHIQDSQVSCYVPT